MKRISKRLFSVLLAAIMIFGSATTGITEISASAETVTSGSCGENATWSFNEATGELVISGTGEMMMTGNGSFSSLDVPWYELRYEIEIVIIENGITSIGKFAFHNCINLTQISIPDSVTIIDDYAFAFCRSLTEITIPKNVSTIEDETFFLCSNLETVEFSAGLKTIGIRAFMFCENLKSADIPNSVLLIAEYAFGYCFKLEEIYIPESAGMHDTAFYKCIGVEKITVAPESTEYSSDENGVLYNKDKTKLLKYPSGNKRTSFDIPDSVTMIDAMAFAFAQNLTSIYISKDLSLDEHCFMGAKFEKVIVDPEHESICSDENGVIYNKEKTALYYYPSGNENTYFEIPESVVWIAECSIMEAQNLKRVYIPKSVESLDEFVFYDCKSLVEITVDSENEYYSSENGVLFNKDKTLMICYPASSLNNFYIIPDSVTTIRFTSFKNFFYSGCEYVHIPKTAPSLNYDGIVYDNMYFQLDIVQNGTDMYFCSETTESEFYEVAKAIGIEFRICDGNHGQPSEHIHSYTSEITTQPACDAEGVRTYTCTCGSSYTEKIAKIAHTVGEWVVLEEPTIVGLGKKAQYCSACKKYVNETSVEKLDSSSMKDASTGIEIVYPSEIYGEDFSPVISVNTDSSINDIIKAVIDDVIGCVAYDIEFTESGKVQIKIPLPEGYNASYTYIYYISQPTGKAEKIEAEYENGYMVFETEKSGTFIIAELEEKVTAVIANPSTTTISYGDSIILHAEVTGTLPAGATIQWSVNNGNFDKVAANDGMTCRITPNSSGDTTFTIKVVAADGEVIAEDTQDMTSKAGLFDKIIGFFKKLFGLTKTIPQALKRIF